MERLTVSLFVILSFYTGAYYCFAFHCANCTNATNYTLCFEELVRCRPGTQYCKFEWKIVDNQTLYTLGCADHQECQVTTKLPAETTLSAVTTTTMTTTTTNETRTTLNTTDALTTQDPANTTIAPDTTKSQLSTTSTNDVTTTQSLTKSTAYTTRESSNAGIIGKRYSPHIMSDDLEDLILDAADHCLECCQGSMCNLETLACVPGLCYDKLGKKACATAKESFNVCSNITFAKDTCKETCELCDLVDGIWAPWSEWTDCSVSCGNGTHSRTRNCTDPAPANKGENCTGDPTEEMACERQACPMDGNWGTWNGWSECSKTCGVGLRFKDRTCSHPAPDQDGLFCQGEPRDYEVCKNDTCEDGHWDLWSDWSECSTTCGLGQRSRHRNCSGTEPEVFKTICFGDAREKDLCNLTDCEDGLWREWSDWSSCSSTCGMGLKTRSRDCGGQLGHSCPGPNTESNLCRTSQCEDDMSAFATTGVPVSGDRNGTLKFTLVLTNVGHDYDNETGVFTCRITGLYQFFVSIEKQINVSQAYCRLMVNNSATILIAARSAFIHSDGYQQASNSMVLDLKKGDEVYLGYCSDPSSMTKEGVFSGSLLSMH
ncbi:coadhesin-like isoform X2 [Dreissena polymorpha]|uniref:coadhesin-like isoform X2 n=1 Tax=Dreissena polymorpha TaxID=45954 RepID=UPI002263D135|nr:coadhesin-like isoform X2 [Dreissena polymorpha]